MVMALLSFHQGYGAARRGEHKHSGTNSKVTRMRGIQILSNDFQRPLG